MDIIQANPYRILGICSNSSIRERISNRDRLNAFLKVGKPISFPMDLFNLLPSVSRSMEMVVQADAKLTLPNEQLHYAQFWFIKASPIDEIALNHLIAGNMENAISIWEKKEDAFSLQNRIVCSLIRNNYVLAISYAERLYSLYASDFVKAVLGNTATVSVEHLEYDFIDVLCQEFGFNQVLSQTSNEKWKEHIRKKTMQPLMNTLQLAIDTTKSSKGSEARLIAGVKLMNDTKIVLQQLKTLLPVTDLQYQMIVDKLGLEILQCGIDYYNDSEEPDAAHKAMELHSYAQMIVVGKMAKDRCKENVDTLKMIIEELPPIEIYEEDKAIKEELEEFSQLPNKICHAVTLLRNCSGHLLYIKTVLGNTDDYYLKMSTLVVNAALYNVIEEVNEVQKEDMMDIGGQQYSASVLLSGEKKIEKLRSTFKAAREAIRLMDTFDMKADFKSDRFDENKRILYNLCSQVEGIKIPTPPHVVPPSGPNGKEKEMGCFGHAVMISIVVLIVIASIYGLEGVATTLAIICGISIFGIKATMGSSDSGISLILIAIAVVSGLISYGLFHII